MRFAKKNRINSHSLFINQPKSTLYGSKEPLWPHILAQLDEIYLLVRELPKFLMIKWSFFEVNVL
jgi:hypothetical protein